MGSGRRRSPWPPQVLLPVPLRLLRVPLPFQRAVQQPGPGHLLALHPGEAPWLPRQPVAGQPWAAPDLCLPPPAFHDLLLPPLRAACHPAADPHPGDAAAGATAGPRHPHGAARRPQQQRGYPCYCRRPCRPASRPGPRLAGGWRGPGTCGRGAQLSGGCGSLCGCSSQWRLGLDGGDGGHHHRCLLPVRPERLPPREAGSRLPEPRWGAPSRPPAPPGQCPPKRLLST